MAHRRVIPALLLRGAGDRFHEEAAKAAVTAEKITNYLRAGCTDTKILGGGFPIARIKDRYRYQCVIKYRQENELQIQLKKILEHYKRDIAQKHVMISIDMNPYMLM